MRSPTEHSINLCSFLNTQAHSLSFVCVWVCVCVCWPLNCTAAKGWMESLLFTQLNPKKAKRNVRVSILFFTEFHFRLSHAQRARRKKKWYQRKFPIYTKFAIMSHWICVFEERVNSDTFHWFSFSKKKKKSRIGKRNLWLIIQANDRLAFFLCSGTKTT